MKMQIIGAEVRELITEIREGLLRECVSLILAFVLVFMVE